MGFAPPLRLGTPPPAIAGIERSSLAREVEATMGFEPMIRVLQDPTVANQTLARLLPNPV
jgi:hypothetical protein